MTNLERFKTSKERSDAFWKYYAGRMLPYDAVVAFAEWLDSDSDGIKPYPCPFCESSCHVEADEFLEDGFMVFCDSCDYQSMKYDSEQDAVIAHNRVSKAFIDAKERK